MQIIENSLNNIKIMYPIENLGVMENMLFIDIETTGFTARSSNLYLIGCLYYDYGWKTKQFFADEYSDEYELLTDFYDFSKDFNTLIHFNGNNFDVPYIEAKSKELGIDKDLSRFKGIDIYKRISPYKNFLKLENCKQKTVEKFLGIKREDTFSGGDLINVYHEYAKSKDADSKKFLLLHNYEDLKGMLEILPALAYFDMFTKKLTVTKVSANYYEDEAGETRSEIMMIMNLPADLITPVSFLYDRCYFSGAGNQGMLRVPLYEEEMKYFYANYKEYYYLPKEDIALHKSVSSFVDKEFREQAKASNCYTRKFGRFLPEWEALVEPFFKREYDSKEMFFELTDELKTDREMFSQYASLVLNHLVI